MPSGNDELFNNNKIYFPCPLNLLLHLMHIVRDLSASWDCAVSSPTYALAETKCVVHSRVQDLGDSDQRIFAT